MITRPVANSLLITLFALLCSCQSVRVNVNYNDQVDFFDFENYAWLEAPQKNDKGYVSMKDQTFQNMVDKTLVEKGFSKTDKDKADVLVALSITEKDKVYFSNIHPSYYTRGRYGYAHHHWYEPEEYTESTIVLALIDPKSKKAVWEGRSRNTSFSSLSKANLQKIIDAFFNHYPPLPEGDFETDNSIK